MKKILAFLVILCAVVIVAQTFNPTRPKRDARPVTVAILPQTKGPYLYCERFSFPLEYTNTSNAGTTFVMTSGDGQISVTPDGVLVGELKPPAEFTCNDSFTVTVTGGSSDRAITVRPNRVK